MALCESNGSAICFNKLTSELHLSKLTLTSSISSKPPSINNNLSSFVNRICNLFCLSSFFNFYILFMCLHHWRRSSIFIHKHNKQMTLRLFTLTLMVTTSLPTLTGWYLNVVINYINVNISIILQLDANFQVLGKVFGFKKVCLIQLEFQTIISLRRDSAEKISVKSF